MEWQCYNRTGRVYAAPFTQPGVLKTPEGSVEVKPGDYMVVDQETTRAWRFPGWRFNEAFVPGGRTVPFKTLARLSEIVSSHVITTSTTGVVTCVRCGKEGSAELFGDRRTCPDCALQIRAEREEAKVCHADGTKMEKHVVDQIIIDRCPTCGGVWFDGGEIQVLGSMLEEAAGGIPAEVAAAFLTGLAAR
ncbi:MAG: zf-TFIIB domain-containing protein [Gemmatimonadota bacterium]